ncbi:MULTISPECIES: hypothetical protein [unclassified Clostridium]|uniref:transmembrane-type terpene cyclase n=1 Tax=unclassified Clostridium TaxID=2614128 RepID=UPI0002972635|nr:MULTISPECIES: hypothetical protein [unclassified Clostridium]EKQ51730.1 MAG: hypothetical protein A370_04715 [Clostridium sp. Maddingley MBC34-26]
MELTLLLVTGFCWTLVYLQMIYLGFKEKTYGMPFIALALNFSWEALHSYLGLKTNFPSVQTCIILVWLLLDFFIICTYLLYGKKYFPKQTSKEYFIPWTIIIFIMSFVIQYFFVVEFNELGKVYSAFIQNLIMSVLFIIMLVQRTDTKGQSLFIAINKWVGTLAPTILYGIIWGCKLVLILGIFCSIFDILYIHFLDNVMNSSAADKNTSITNLKFHNNKKNK